MVKLKTKDCICDWEIAKSSQYSTSNKIGAVVVIIVKADLVTRTDIHVVTDIDIPEHLVINAWSRIKESRPFSIRNLTEEEDEKFSWSAKIVLRTTGPLKLNDSDEMLLKTQFLRDRYFKSRLMFWLFTTAMPEQLMNDIE